MKAPWAGLCAVGSLVVGSLGVLLAGSIAHDNASTFVRVISIVWVATGLVQVALVAVHEWLGLGRLAHFMVAVVLGGASSTGVLMPTVRAGGATVLAVLAGLWLLSLVALLIEFAMDVGPAHPSAVQTRTGAGGGERPDRR